MPTLDPVPRQWRHITMTGMGHVHDVPDELRDKAVENVRRALDGFGPIDATFSTAAVFPEAVAVRPDVPESFTTLQNLAQQATADAVPGADAHNPRFRAHVSAHYSNGTAPVAPIRARLAAAGLQPAPARIASLDLIRMHRDHRMYEWEPVDAVTLIRE